VGLYMSPPEHALVLAVDEKSQIQALDRTAPCLPARSCRRGASLLRHVRVVPCTLLPEFVPACTKPRGQDDRAWGSGPAVRIGQPRGPGERPPASCRLPGARIRRVSFFWRTGQAACIVWPAPEFVRGHDALQGPGP
jgi:hypothetical protein